MRIIISDDRILESGPTMLLEVQSSSRWTAEHGWFDVVHHSRPENWLKTLRARRCLELGGAILFVSGARRAGLDDEQVRQLNEEHQGRVHVLDGSHSLEAPFPRMMAFLEVAQHLASSAVIPWENLYGTAAPEPSASRTSYSQAFTQLWNLLDQNTPPEDPSFRIDWDDLPHQSGPVNTHAWLTPIEWALAMHCKWPGASLRVSVYGRGLQQFANAPSLTILRAVPDLLPFVRLDRDFGQDEAGGHLLDPLTLRRMWLGVMLTPSTRHALANLVGIRILLRSVGHAMLDEPIDKLMRYVLGYQQPLESPAPAAMTVAAHGILIDDMAAQGWANYLQANVVLDSFEVHTALPDQALDEIERSLQSGERLWKTKEPIILFLDLRLYAGEPELREQYLQRLRHMAERHLPGLDGLDDTLGELIWLPAALAKANPRLPIILFSTTNRKEVLERLEPYPNIVGSFSKPSLSLLLEGGDVAEVTRQQLLAAVGAAARLASGQRALRRVRDEPVRFRPLELGPEHRCIDIFLDESGDFRNKTPLVFGGVLLAGPEWRRFDELERKLASLPEVWGPSRSLLNVPLARMLPKRTSPAQVTQVLRSVQGVLTGLGIEAAAFGLSLSSDPAKWEPVTGSEGFYRLCMAALLEAVLFDLIVKRVNPETQPEIRIHLATRSCKVDPAQVGAVVEQLGVRLRGDAADPYYLSFEFQDGYPMVEAVLRRRRVFRQWRVARAYRLLQRESKSLPHYRLTREEAPWQAHYLADWASNLLRSAVLGQAVPGPLQHWLDRGFLTHSGGGFDEWLSASRLHDEGMRVESLAVATRALAERREGQGFQDLVLRKLAPGADEISPETFYAFCDRLALDAAAAAASSKNSARKPENGAVSA